MNRRVLWCILGLAVSASATARSIDPPAEGEKPAPAAAPEEQAKPSDADALKGPTVKAERAAPTLVQRDFAGKVVRLQMHPAEAAVKQLKLDAASKEKVDAVLLERSRLLDQLVTENLELLVKLQGSREAGEQVETTKLVRELAEKAAPLKERGQLAQELIGVLPSEQGKELKRLVQEYWKAIVDEDLAQSADERQAKGESTSRRDKIGDGRDAMKKEVLAIAGLEIRNAYERTIGQRSKDFDATIKELQLTPEQESKVRKIVGDSFTKTYGKASAKERSQVFWQVYQVLDADQKKLMLKKVGGGHGMPPAEGTKP